MIQQHIHIQAKQVPLDTRPFGDKLTTAIDLFIQNQMATIIKEAKEKASYEALMADKALMQKFLDKINALSAQLNRPVILHAYNLNDQPYKNSNGTEFAGTNKNVCGGHLHQYGDNNYNRHTLVDKQNPDGKNNFCIVLFVPNGKDNTSVTPGHDHRANKASSFISKGAKEISVPICRKNLEKAYTDCVENRNCIIINEAPTILQGNKVHASDDDPGAHIVIWGPDSLTFEQLLLLISKMSREHQEKYGDIQDPNHMLAPKKRPLPRSTQEKPVPPPPLQAKL